VDLLLIPPFIRSAIDADLLLPGIAGALIAKIANGYADGFGGGRNKSSGKKLS
jgi:hypothetical protein